MAEYEVVIRFQIKATDSEDAKSIADAIGDKIYRAYGFDSSTKEVIEYD